MSHSNSLSPSSDPLSGTYTPNAYPDYSSATGSPSAASDQEDNVSKFAALFIQATQEPTTDPEILHRRVRAAEQWIDLPEMDDSTNELLCDLRSRWEVSRLILAGKYIETGLFPESFELEALKYVEELELIGHPVHAAIQADDFDLLQELVRGGCDINSDGENGETPLHLAAWKWTDKPERIKWMLDSGANPLEEDGNWHFPVFQAVDALGRSRLRYFEVIRAGREESEARKVEDAVYAAEAQSVEFLLDASRKAAVEKGVSPLEGFWNHQDEMGDTILHHMARRISRLSSSFKSITAPGTGKPKLNWSTRNDSGVSVLWLAIGACEGKKDVELCKRMFDSLSAEEQGYHDSEIDRLCDKFKVQRGEA